jgi:phosphate transport system protein
METRHFDIELSQLKEKILLMAARVENLVSQSVKALTLRKNELAESIFDLDKEIDMMEIEIEEFAIQLIALHQPAAGDLRFLIGIININKDLERIGDHGVNIAQCAIKLMKEPPLKPLIDIPRMAEEATKMFRESLESFIEGNVDKAREVCRSDYIVDNLKSQLFRELLTYMMEDSGAISRAMQLILVSRNLERIADLATNISEETIYICQAEVIKHGLGLKNKE